MPLLEVSHSALLVRGTPVLRLIPGARLHIEVDGENIQIYPGLDVSFLLSRDPRFAASGLSVAVEGRPLPKQRPDWPPS